MREKDEKEKPFLIFRFLIDDLGFFVIGWPVSTLTVYTGFER